MPFGLRVDSTTFSTMGLAWNPIKANARLRLASAVLAPARSPPRPSPEVKWMTPLTVNSDIASGVPANSYRLVLRAPNPPPQNRANPASMTIAAKARTVWMKPK